MCEVNPFPLKPHCYHMYDDLDRAIMLLFINGKKGKRYDNRAINSLLQKAGHKCYLELVKRRLTLLKKFGWASAGTQHSNGPVRSYGWLWSATFKAVEAHSLWLLAGICPDVAA